MRGLAGENFLVAGGGSGIGAATVLRLAQEGAKVAVGDIDVTAAERTAAQARELGGQALALQYDQADEASIVALVTRAVDAFEGRLYGLHANAADLSAATAGADRQILKMDSDVWERTFRVNVTGYALLIREVLPHLLERRKGAIVCTSSAGSELGLPSQPAYACSKAGVNALIRHVAKRRGPSGIRANAVSPGMVLTESGRKAQSEESLTAMRSATSSCRLGEPEDIAAAVAFLLSRDGEWVNGQVWSVNGGMITRG